MGSLPIRYSITDYDPVFGQSSARMFHSRMLEAPKNNIALRRRVGLIGFPESGSVILENRAGTRITPDRTRCGL